MKTAIDFLLEKITFKKLEHDIYLYPRVSIKDIEEAKEMEKQQIIDAYTHDRVLFQITAEKYFKETFNSKRGLKEVQLKDPNTCEYYKEFGCVKDICNCYTLISKQETLEEAVENRIRGINVNTGFNK